MVEITKADGGFAGADVQNSYNLRAGCSSLQEIICFVLQGGGMIPPTRLDDCLAKPYATNQNHAPVGDGVLDVPPGSARSQTRAWWIVRDGTQVKLPDRSLVSALRMKFAPVGDGVLGVPAEYGCRDCAASANPHQATTYHPERPE